MHANAGSRTNFSLLALIGANLVAIALALYEDWNLVELLFVYWCQSVIIGVFSARRILDLRAFSTEGVYMEGVPVPETAAAKRKIAKMFALHYGAFHLTYLIALVVKVDRLPANGVFLALCVAVFVVNHAYSYLENRERDAARNPNIGTVMYFPYLRIVPMHLTIIVGGSIAGDSTILLLFFLILKMFADVLMHRIEHASWRQ